MKSSILPFIIVATLSTTTAYTKQETPLQLAINEVANTLTTVALLEPVVYASNMYTLYQGIKTLEYGWFTGAKTEEDKKITNDRYYEHFKKTMLGVCISITAGLAKWIQIIHAGKRIISLAV